MVFHGYQWAEPHRCRDWITTNQRLMWSGISGNAIEWTCSCVVIVLVCDRMGNIKYCLLQTSYVSTRMWWWLLWSFYGDFEPIEFPMNCEFVLLDWFNDWWVVSMWFEYVTSLDSNFVSTLYDQFHPYIIWELSISIKITTSIVDVQHIIEWLGFNVSNTTTDWLFERNFDCSFELIVTNGYYWIIVLNYRRWFLYSVLPR